MAGVRDLSGEPYKSHREHHAAKAKLEAAAPDLLRAIKFGVAYIRADLPKGKMPVELQVMLDAIEKAEG